METPVVIQLTEDEAEFLLYLVRQESKGILSDVEASIVSSLLAKLK